MNKSIDHVASAFLRCVLIRMKELGLTQTALAKRMHVSKAYISKLLSHDVNFTFVNAMRLAKALEMDFFPVLATQGSEIKIKTCKKTTSSAKQLKNPLPLK